ncbi:hypothetical protein Tco_0586586 [Tanacetum coccineum]
MAHLALPERRPCPLSQNSTSSSQPYPTYGTQVTPDQVYQQQLAYHQNQQQFDFQNFPNPRNTQPRYFPSIITTAFFSITLKSGENEADHIENAKDTYMERSGNKKFQYLHSWNILKSYPKSDAAKPIDEDNLAELFGLDPRARPAGKP